jgi:multiple sugar transport system substrate-binding protein
MLRCVSQGPGRRHRRLGHAAAALVFAAAGLASGGGVAQERIAVWFPRATYPAEDHALQEVIRRFEAKTGVKVDLVRHSPEEMIAKSAAAVAAGSPPEVGFGFAYDFRLTGKWAFEGRLANLDDVIEPLAGQFLPGPLATTRLRDGKTGRVGYYAAPVQMQLAHIHYWIDMVEAAGFKESDIPNDWKGFWSFWCDKLQPALRARGERVYGIGHPAGARGTDTIFGFHVFMYAHEAEIVDVEGRFVLDQPKNRAALSRALADYAGIVAKGCSPASSLGWGDVENNLQFATRAVAMTHNSTLSIPVAQLDTTNRAAATPEQRETARVNYHERIRTRGFPAKPGGGKLPSLAAVKTAVVFADSRNAQGGKAFLALFLEEERLQRFVEASAGRWVPVTKRASVAPFWTDGKDPHRKAVQQQVAEGLVFFPLVRDWRLTIADTENVWARAVARVAKGDATPEAAADEIVERLRQILAR